MPRKVCTLSCISKQSAVWVTVICIKSAVGIAGVKYVYCTVKCGHQKVRSRVIKANREVEWDEEFIFYRKDPERPLTIKVRSQYPVDDSLVTVRYLSGLQPQRAREGQTHRMGEDPGPGEPQLRTARGNPHRQGQQRSREHLDKTESIHGRQHFSYLSNFIFYDRYYEN